MGIRTPREACDTTTPASWEASDTIPHTLASKILATLTSKTSQPSDEDISGPGQNFHKLKSETKACKSLTAELGARPKDVRRDERDKRISSPKTNVRLKKSGSFREEKKELGCSTESPKEQPSFTSFVSGCCSKLSGDPDAHSPKLVRTESVTERTVQKFSKVIRVRGTSRSDSRSRKKREPSLSPSKKDGCCSSSSISKEEKKKSPSQEKKSAQEKREMFKTQH